MAKNNLGPEGRDKAHEETVLAEVKADFEAMGDGGFLTSGGEQTHLWKKFYTSARSKIIDVHGEIRFDVIRNFWRNLVFLGDNPAFGVPRGPQWLLGDRRGEMAVLDRIKKLLRKHGCRDLMLKYPCPTAGNPHVYRKGKYALTHRWAKHLFNLHRMNEFLKPHLEPGFTMLDIGSGHGLFSCLVNREYPGSRSVLVDLPEPLLVARYFLRMTFPEAKIAGIRDVGDMPSISREWIEQYDFVILPWQLYERLEPGAIDLITSFAALGELTRSVFRYYVDAPVFRTAKFIHTTNPVQTNLMFVGSDVTLMDYPLQRGEGCFHFGISPIFIYPYTYPERRMLFFYRILPFTPFFEYLGRIAPTDASSA